MNVFEIHRRIVDDYSSYIKSFINISDEAIAEVVKTELDKGKLWPKPLLQFNPAFEMSGSVSDVVRSGVLHPSCENIFKGYSLYKHQLDAITLGSAGRDFVVTSGTGSGKSLTYIATVFDRLLKEPSLEGVTAIIVYPMNALINSQSNELAGYKENYEKATGREFPITFGQYTGQESEEKRQQLRENPPHILLTNYMMLELLLTRQRERRIRDAIYKNLEYLVFDELHTYRGRQGADVAMLVRRIRAMCTREVACIGTSATLVSEGTFESRRQKVADVASKIFGKKFLSEQVVDESLMTSLNHSSTEVSAERLASALSAGIDPTAGEDSLKTHPLANWLEREAALDVREGRLVRRVPLAVDEIVKKLADSTGLDLQKCESELVKMLLWISVTNQKIQSTGSRYTILPFKLHQFFAQTGSVYTTLDSGEDRFITLEPGIYKNDAEGAKPIFANVFSRESGHPFICVTLVDGKMLPREFEETSDGETGGIDGYLILGEGVWSPGDEAYLPDSWFKNNKSGRIPTKDYEDRLPRKIYYDELGNWSFESGLPKSGWFMTSGLLFDPTSGTFYEAKTRENTKLSKLGSEGRSTSTTITTFSILNRLNEAGISLQDQKLLSFVDNRQDAALQSGHFNDFVKVIQLRSAIHRALKDAEGNTLDFTKIGPAVAKALNLPFTEFANRTSEPELDHLKTEYQQALENFIFFRALADLRRSWRIVLPNLEQCGLLSVSYKDLLPTVESDKFWSETPILNQLSANDRAEFLSVLLDFFRFEQAINSEGLLKQERLKEFEKLFREKLKLPWSLDRGETLAESCVVRLEAIDSRNLSSRSIGSTSGVGKWIRAFVKEKGLDSSLVQGAAYDTFVSKLMERLTNADFLKEDEVKGKNGQKSKVYQLRIERIQWRLGDGSAAKSDPIKRRSYKRADLKPNEFFRNLYLLDLRDRKILRADEHTGALKNEDRIDREERFRADWFKDEAKKDLDNDRIKREAISALFCSPTMELGVDIGGLSVVHMRNAPPNPANYAQRSGRAGRSGQGALVFTYCSSYSPHDRHYFSKQAELVAGVVSPPSIDLLNRELLLTHLNALAISEIGMPGGLGEGGKPSIANLVDIHGDGLPMLEAVRTEVTLLDTTRERIAAAFRRTVSDFSSELETNKAGWYSEDWIKRNLAQLPNSLDSSLERWRTLYRNAQETLNRASVKLNSGLLIVRGEEYKEAERLQGQSNRQLNLLRNETKKPGDLSEFYPFRYLASEGFLPGYNFTRLPLRIFIPDGSSGGEFISRPRPVALREFGPLNLIYHKRRKYQVKHLLVQETEESIKRARISKKSGYYLDEKDIAREICPFSGVVLSENDNVAHLTDMLEMTESKAIELDRISCEEEDRASRGFQIDTYFSVDGDVESSVKRAAIRSGETVLLNLRFIPAARLIQVNRKWRSQKVSGFPLGMTTGEWRSAVPSDESKVNEQFRLVTLMTSDTADALYIEPVASLGLEADGVVTLQYALKRAIETVFQVESSEIGVVSMGDGPIPNIFIYEAAEGSLGILSQFVENIDVFKPVIEAAIEVCRYDDTDYKAPASYDDLLTYYNQRDHRRIDRFLIKDALEKLRVSNIEVVDAGFGDYEDHYRALLRSMDPNSSTERNFLKHLYDNGLRLPDAAQKYVDGIYCQPDFYYEKGIWIFCDGSPHDDPEVKARDEEQRQILISRGDQVWSWHYRENLAEKVAKRPDIFKKVR